MTKKQTSCIQDFDELYDIPKEVSVTEAVIYDWVVDHFGTSEAEDPSWNIHLLAEHLNKKCTAKYKQKHPIRYLKV